MKMKICHFVIKLERQQDWTRKGNIVVRKFTDLPAETHFSSSIAFLHKITRAVLSHVYIHLKCMYLFSFTILFWMSFVNLHMKSIKIEKKKKAHNTILFRLSFIFRALTWTAYLRYAVLARYQRMNSHLWHRIWKKTSTSPCVHLTSRWAKHPNCHCWLLKIWCGAHSPTWNRRCVSTVERLKWIQTIQ